MKLPKPAKSFESGRYCLAIIAGIVFLICAITGKIEGKDVVIILTLVFQAYFNKQRTPNSERPEKAALDA